MFGVSFNLVFSAYYFLFVLTSLYIIELFYLASYGRRVYWIIRKTCNSFTLLSHKEINYYINLQLFILLTLKLSKYHCCGIFDVYNLYLVTFLFFFKILLYLSKVASVSRDSLNMNFTVLLFSFVTVANFYFVTNLITFIFILELIGVTYYFFFLNKLTTSSMTFIKYKNLISMYLWTSFAILILIFMCSLVTAYSVGTLGFSELGYVSFMHSNINWHILIFGLFWKIGAPGFHFFKLQIYQFLPVYANMLFSTLSLFINFFLYHFVIMAIISSSIFIKPVFLLYILIVNIYLLIRVQKNIAFYDFFGYSSINTWATLLLFGLF